MHCPTCNSETPPGNRFCGKCGTGLPADAPPRQSKENHGFGRADTHRRNDPVPPEAGHDITPDGERKTITALFADIKGSMELMEDLDPEEARAIIDPALQLMMGAVRHYGGHVAQSTGDGIFALFGAPIAHEDHPQRAVYAALKMQADITTYGDKLQKEGQAPIYIRVGLNTGEVVVRSIRKDEAHSDYLPVGHSTGLAHRMQSIARPGSILLTDYTYKSMQGYFQFRALGPTTVKGLSEPINVYEVTGLGPLRTRLQVSARRGFTKFVGRQREMETLRHALEQAKRGLGQVLSVVGEAGVGKSRLFHEFKAIAQSECLVLAAFSVSFGRVSAYLPVIELLTDYFRIRPEDDERVRREKIGGKVLMLDRSLEDTLPCLLTLLAGADSSSNLAAIDVELRRRRTHEAIKRLLVRESLNQPLLVIFEDLHWIDTETQALLNVLVDGIATARVLLLTNYRPEYRDEWDTKSCYTQLRLEPFGHDIAEEMLESLLGQDPALAPVKRFIVEKTSGTPFYMEEITNALFEQGVLIRGAGVPARDAGFNQGAGPQTGDSAVSVAKPVTDIKIPNTVQGVIAARIDRLTSKAKELLQIISVIGRESSVDLIRAVSELPASELPGFLSELQLGEFICETPALPEPDYGFKHALTQEVAYNSVLIERRRLLHGRIANAIESLFAGKLEEHLSELARHYERSADREKAVEYLRRAGDQARERFAFSEALTHLDTGLKLIETLPESSRARHEILLQGALSKVFRNIKGPGAEEVGAALNRALNLSERFGDDSELFPILRGLRLFYSQRLQLAKAREFGDRMLALAERSAEPELISDACLSLSDMFLVAGDLHAARATAERGIATATVDGVRARCLAALSGALRVLGFPDQAENCINEAQALARREGDVYWLAYALVSAGRAFSFSDGPRFQALAEQAIKICSEYGNSFMLAEATCQRGAAMVAQGAAPEGIAEIERGLDAWRATGSLPRGRFFAALAEACLRAGRAEQGLNVVSKALAQAEETGARVSEAEIYRIKGELTLLRDARDEKGAENCFAKAIELAGRQGAKSWELRATMSLARLLEKQGRREEAGSMLQAIYGWFTEGFDTADLQEAKALLEKLG